MELIAPPDVTSHSDDAPDADVFDDPTTNPRAELEALERAHLLIGIHPPNTVGEADRPECDQAAALSAVAHQFHGSSSCRCAAG